MDGWNLKLFQFAKKIYSFPRSITGNGVRQTLAQIKDLIPELKIHEIKTGKKVFDWNIPKEWSVEKAFIECPDGKKICDFSKNNLHLLNYSSPIKGKFSLKELEKHLYYLKEKPEAIPYVTSYYEDRWGFCLSYKERKKLKEGSYKVVIDSKKEKGSLTIGEIILKGKLKKEVFISTYTCHPSMGNNETSGITVAVFLAKWIKESLTKRNYTYRIVFAPETIGALSYLDLNNNLEKLKKNVKFAFNITCVGDDKNFSYLPSRNGNLDVDKISRHVLKHLKIDYKEYDFFKDRGSDECQYSSPGVNLPMVSLMRSKYGEYDEYHTSLDDLNFISQKGLEGSLSLHKRCIEIIEKNCCFITDKVGEPFFSKYNLRSTLSATAKDMHQIKKYSTIVNCADGKSSLVDVADFLDIPVWDLFNEFENLIEAKIIKKL